MTDEDDILEHSELGPSGAHRWRKCPLSMILSRGLPDTAGIEAAYGTCFHHFAALCLKFDVEPQTFVGRGIVVPGHGRIEFDQKMADNMLSGLDLARSYMNIPEAVVLIEERVPLKEWVAPRQFGTTDLSIFSVERRLIVGFDWKYGAGVMVHPFENDQAMLYLLGAWSQFGRDLFEAEGLDPSEIEVLIIIEQPRGEGGGGEWRTTMDVVLKHGEAIRKDAQRCFEPNPIAVPGRKQCEFCKAGRFNKCRAKAEYALEQIGTDFDDLELATFSGLSPDVKEAEAFTPEERSAFLLNWPLFKDLYEDLHRSAYRDAEKGLPTPLMKLVKGRSPARKWRDPVKAEIILTRDLGERAFIKTLLSAPQVEEEVGKKAFAKLYKNDVTVGEAKDILVPDTDGRNALASFADDFDESMV